MYMEKLYDTSISCKIFFSVFGFYYIWLFEDSAVIIDIFDCLRFGIELEKESG